MVQEREPGKELFVDWMGDKPELVLDSESGKMLKAHFFVGTLGDSGYPVAEAFPDEKENAWLTAHVHTFNHLGGLPAMVVPDNCRTAVYKPSYYDPELNRAYAELAAYYRVAVIPARVRAPRDKGQVEETVGWLETWLLQWLLERGPYGGFAELNAAVLRRMAELVKRPFQKRAGSRESVFLALDKPALRPLPPEPYEVANWLTRRVPDNYHVEYDGFYYSVPYQYYKQEVQMRVTYSLIQVFDGHRKQIAVHERHYTGRRYITLVSHMPQNHQAWQEGKGYDGVRYRSWAKNIGVHTFTVIDTILSLALIEQTVYRSCMGILQCGKQYGNDRLEAACKKAEAMHSYSYSTVHNILRNKQEAVEDEEGTLFATPSHDNIRGPAAFK
jgi:hypothetical protein